jgi:hypothetical protein
MKITTDYSNSSSEEFKVESAIYITDYTVKIFFTDGSQKLVDFKPFLENSFHPNIRKYLDESLFKKFTVEGGNLNWNDYDLIFPLADLYEGEI